MPYDKGLADYEIGRHTAADNPAREEHLARAREILDHLDAAHDLARTLDAPATG